MAFLLLWAAPRQAPASARMKHALLAGAALASAAGGAIYVAFVFGIFLIGWTAVALAKRWRRETAVLTGAGLAGMALSLPFALSLRGPALEGLRCSFGSARSTLCKRSLRARQSARAGSCLWPTRWRSP